jgi:hypothetical protein
MHTTSDPEGAPPPRLPFGRRLLLALACFLVGIAVVPRWLGGCGAGALFDGDVDAQRDLGDAVAKTAVDQRGAMFFQTGDPRFDGQASLAIYQMTILGLGQIVLEHPETKDDYLPAMRAAGDALADPATIRYAAQVYGQHAAVRMDPGEGHAYAGYINIALAMLRLVDPTTRHAALNDRLTEQLRTRLLRAPNGLIETYPGETWPPDVAVVAGSIGLHAKATGADVQKDMDTWAERFERCAVHSSGYLIQRLRTGTCTAVDAPRGSGTALGSYVIGFAHRGLSRRLHDALVKHGTITLVGLGGIREYAEGFHGHGDVNAGPIVLGASVGATGFGLGAARMNGDRELYGSLYRSAHLFGIPVGTGAGTRFALGGALGNALLLAMLTARAP